LKDLRIQGHEVTGLFYNPNIHPYQEYLKRKQALNEYAISAYLNVIFTAVYQLEEFLRHVAQNEKIRCEYCLESRLRYTAELARRENFDAFTTTLLYSKYQKHDLIREKGEKLSRQLEMPFYYQDFRSGWSDGVKISKELGMYRQQYCGCIYSEKERFCKEI
jgi:hypothetical protein